MSSLSKAIHIQEVIRVQTAPADLKPSLSVDPFAS